MIWFLPYLMGSLDFFIFWTFKTYKKSEVEAFNVYCILKIYQEIFIWTLSNKLHEFFYFSIISKSNIFLHDRRVLSYSLVFHFSLKDTEVNTEKYVTLLPYSRCYGQLYTSTVEAWIFLQTV